MGASRSSQLTQDGDTKSAQGDFARAINLYEAALDDSPRCAEIHYKLALLYDDKLNDPVSALHHFRRYLALSPTGAHAADVKNSIKHDEIAALTVLSGDSVITRTEAARLRNENLNLHKELEARAVPMRPVIDKSPREGDTSSKKATSEKKDRSYVVQQGDTLFSISRKFYKSPKHWKEILNANRKNIHDPKKLTVGQSLVIP
jgi:LysM repeat protein